MKPRLAAALLIMMAVCGRAADDRARILSFASENWLNMAIGKFEPGKGWVQSTQFYTPPEPMDFISIFGLRGKLGEVVVIDSRRALPQATYADWSAEVKRGKTKEQPYALAIQGSWPDTGVESKELGVDDPESLRIVADFLKTRGLKVETPTITQAYQVDMDGTGILDRLICAHSDLQSLRNDQPGVVYAVALLHTSNPGKEKTLPLAAQCSYKPANRTIEDQQRLYGPRDFYRFLTFHDIDGDGKREIVLYRAKDDATQVDVFTFDGRRARKVLSAYKPAYN